VASGCGIAPPASPAQEQLFSPLLVRSCAPSNSKESQERSINIHGFHHYAEERLKNALKLIKIDRAKNRVSQTRAWIDTTQTKEAYLVNV
jgi:hypothetical protein